MTESKVHLKLFVSFFMVIIVVAQGQWKRKKTMVQRAFEISKPFSEKSTAVSEREPSLERVSPEYPMAITGRAISFAGREKTNPESIVPSRPKSFAKGSRKPAKSSSTVFSPKKEFEHSQIITPAGAATVIALPRILRVRSKTERTITFPIFGILYGGSSRVKLAGIPLSTVFESIFETKSVMSTEKATNPVRIAAPSREESVKNIAISAIIAGSLPLQGIKLFVIMEMSLSRGESMILEPVTPTAPQPIPMHMLGL